VCTLLVLLVSVPYAAIERMADAKYAHMHTT
jgi:hypothetical protein